MSSPYVMSQIWWKNTQNDDLSIKNDWSLEIFYIKSHSWIGQRLEKNIVFNGFLCFVMSKMKWEELST